MYGYVTFAYNGRDNLVKNYFLNVFNKIKKDPGIVQQHLTF